MIIDEILDRKEYEKQGNYAAYNARDFYYYCIAESTIFHGIADEIIAALDYGGNADIQAALCRYVIANGYNPDICGYINRVNWID